MFCSKCGKEIKDDAVFCDKCGNQVSGEVNHRNNNTSSDEKTLNKMAETEKYKKIRAIITFIISSIACLLYIMVIFASDFEAVTTLINTYAGVGNRLNEELGKYGSVCIFVQAALIALEAVFVYILPYKNRAFSTSGKISGIFMGASSFPLAAFFVILFLGKLEEKFELTSLFWIAVVIFAALDIAKIITYRLAVNEEADLLYHENSSAAKRTAKLGASGEDWKCKHCGSTNKSAQDYCKDCGEYR